MTSPKFDVYIHPGVKDSHEDETGYPMTTDADYVFDGYSQPPYFAEAMAVRLGRVAREAKIDPDASDIEVNQAIVNSAAAEERKHPRVDAYESQEKIPCTYDMAEFIDDTDAAYATDLLCTAWLELYGHQMKTGDYPPVKLDRTKYNKRKYPRAVPRQLAEKLPDGSKSEGVEIYLTPELYLEYVKAGLIPEGIGGKDGRPRIYWFERDGDGYKAGTNAETIYLTERMNPLAAANIRGTYSSVTFALNKIPTMLSVAEQDLKDYRDAQAQEDARRRAARWNREPFRIHFDW